MALKKKDNPMAYLAGFIKRISNFDMSTFKGRKILQKTVYLMQAFGINVGYRFSWYIHSPYCSELADHGYQLAEVYKEHPERKFVDEEAEKNFEKFKEFIEDKKKDSNLLELLTSLHYLQENNPEADKDIIFAQLIEEHKEFNIEDCEKAWEILKKHGLVHD